MTAHEELFDMLRTMADADATEVLQRIKSGIQPDHILHLIRGNLLVQLSLKPESSSRDNFLYLRELPAYLLRPTNLYFNTLAYDFPLRRKLVRANQILHMNRVKACS
jgi:hypothetical protein